MKLRLLTTILLLSCGITNFADAMKRSHDEQEAAESRSARYISGGNGAGSGDSAAAEQEVAQCVICQENLEPTQDIRALPCSHSFHSDCIAPWLTTHNTCPTCRAVVPGAGPAVAPFAPPAIPLHPLHTATSNGDLSAVLTLLIAGANPNTLGEDNYTPLHLAAANGHTAIAQVLIDAGSNPDTQDIDINWTPLHRAAIFGHTATTQALIAAGANPNIQDIGNWTPLHIAARYGHTTTVQALLTAPGIDTTITNTEGQTALDVAANDGIRAIIQAHNAAHQAAEGTEAGAE